MRKILILAANPNDVSPSRLDEEVRDICKALERAKKRDKFEVVQRWAVRPRDLQQAMLDESPQIVHFTGHSDGAAGLFFEDAVGQAKLVTGDALASLFKLFEDELKCVVLNGCYSYDQAETIAEHVPHVIGMRWAVNERAAIEFAVGFYDALGSGRPVEFAFEFGKSAMELVNLDGADFDKLLSAARELQSEYSRASVLSQLAKQVCQDFLPKIRDAINSLPQKPVAAKSLGDSLTYFPLEKISYVDWQSFLHLLAYLKRSDLMQDLVTRPSRHHPPRRRRSHARRSRCH